MGSSSKRIIKQLRSDAELDKDGKTKDHYRKQKLLDTQNSITQIVMWVVPFTILIGIVVLSIHYVLSNQWDKFENVIIGVAIYIAGFITSYLKKNGISNE